jgi:hypothetical protein
MLFPLVASPKQAMKEIQVSRDGLYERINTDDLKSHTERKSRRMDIIATKPQTHECLEVDGDYDPAPAKLRRRQFQS